MSEDNYNPPSIDDIKAQIEKRQKVTIPESLWELIEPKTLGIENNAVLASPDAAVHDGPGGRWKITKTNEGVILNPVSREDVDIFQRSIS